MSTAKEVLYLERKIGILLMTIVTNQVKPLSIFFFLDPAFGFISLMLLNLPIELCFFPKQPSAVSSLF